MVGRPPLFSEEMAQFSSELFDHLPLTYWVFRSQIGAPFDRSRGRLSFMNPEYQEGGTCGQVDGDMVFF